MVFIIEMARLACKKKLRVQQVGLIFKMAASICFLFSFYSKLDGIRLRAVENDASVIEQFYKPKQKKFFEFKFNCKPLTGSQNIVITSNFSYTYMTL